MSSSAPVGLDRACFTRRHLRAFVLAALLGRLAYGMVGFALLLRVRDATGSYASAGLALVGFGLGAAVLAPLRGRWVDRVGRRGSLPWLATGAGGALVAVALLPAAPVGLVVLSGVAGCLVPPLGPVCRSVWAELAPDPEALRRAYSLDTVAEEGLFLAGPLLVGALVTVAAPWLALSVAAAVLLLGALVMARSPLSASRTAAPAGAGPSPLGERGFRGLLLVCFGAGAGLGGLELATVAAAHRVGPGGLGVLLAAASLGSALGGAAYGARSWSGSARTHLRNLAALLGVALAALAWVAGHTGPVLLGAGLLAAGLFVAPLLVAAYTRAEELTGACSRTEAGTLVSTLSNLGISAGTALTGLLLDHRGPPTALLVGAGVLGLTAVVAAAA
jgi:MFS family permease